MKKNLQITFILLLVPMIGLFARTNLEQTEITFFDKIVFYDMYASIVNESVPEGVIRHANDRYAIKIKDEQLALFGKQIQMNITIGALCDNYDRIAGVELAFVPKGSITYDTKAVRKIEVGRFITPFMNKNKQPTEVPYSFDVNNIYYILNDENLKNQYDFWIEFRVHGVPYAAQNEVAGCSGRIDTFEGTLKFITSDANENPDKFKYFFPLQSDVSLNNYDATDVPGETIRLIDFYLENPIESGSFFLITSNHGANTGGEEYVRRQHFVYLNDQEIYTYKPGGKSCEPYRQYNTQGNGIYGANPQSEAWWTNWNNWCPGDAIPIRRIDVGNLNSGQYTFKLDVPDAVFNQQQGYIPVSLYFQAKTELLSITNVRTTDVKIYPNPASDFVELETKEAIDKVEIYGINGELILSSSTKRTEIKSLKNGVYILKATLKNGQKFSHKIIKN